jgi:hypothetical protein
MEQEGLDIVGLEESGKNTRQASKDTHPDDSQRLDFLLLLFCSQSDSGDKHCDG